MKKQLIISGLMIIGAGIIVGCSSTPPPAAEAQPETMIPMYVAGRNLGDNQLPNVRNGENVEVYSIGRYVDPNNSNIMYEKNVLYRVKDDASWNTRPNLPVKLPGGTNVVLPENVNPVYVKPLYAELESRVMAMKDANAKNTKAYAEMINRGSTRINAAAQKMEKLIKQNQSLIQEQQQLNKKIAAMQKNYNTLKSKINQKKGKMFYKKAFNGIAKAEVNNSLTIKQKKEDSHYVY